jgi:hypothetical protein
MSTFRFLVLATLLAFPSAGEAATYYVGMTGSNSTSCAAAQNAATPKATIRAALACIGVGQGAGAGQTIIVKPGTYPEELRWNEWPSGTFGNPFTLKAEDRGTCGDTFGGCTVTLLPTTGVCQGLPCYNMEIGDTGVDLYIVIDGLKLDGSNLCCANAVGIGGGHSLRPYGNRFTAQYIEIKDPMSSSISSTTNDGTFTHIAINGCSRDQAYKNGTGHNVMYMGGSRNVYDYITVAGPNCVHNELTVYNGGGGGPPSQDNVFDHCLTNGVGVGLYSGARNVVRNCLILNNRPAYQESGAGVTVAYGCADCQVLNNTIVNNIGQCVHVNSVGNPGVVIQNNICWQNGGGIVNDMSGGAGAVISNNLTTEPSFSNPTTSTSFKDRFAENFKLRLGSAGINKGVNLALRGITDDIVGVARQGNNYDIGAYAFMSSSSDTIPPLPPHNVRVQ